MNGIFNPESQVVKQEGITNRYQKIIPPPEQFMRLGTDGRNIKKNLCSGWCLLLGFKSGLCIDLVFYCIASHHIRA